jgi:hypothetical protein
MRKAIHLLLALALAGCYGQNTIRKDPEASALTLGQFTTKAAQLDAVRSDKIVETSSQDESASFRHWQVYFFAKCGACDTDKSNAENFLNNYGEYCVTRGGQWSIAGPRPSGTCAGPRPFEIRVSVYSTPDPLVRSSRYFYLLVDAFERKEGTTRPIEDEYRIEPVTRMSNASGVFSSNSQQALRFNAYIKRDQAAEAVVRDTDRLQRAADAVARKNEQTIRQAAAEATYLPKTKTVGQQICRLYGGQEQYQTRMGYTTGVIDRTFRVLGFTEKVAGDKIQIRIGSIEMFDPASGQRKNVERLGGSPELKVNTLIWDNAIDWQPC